MTRHLHTITVTNARAGVDCLSCALFYGVRTSSYWLAGYQRTSTLLVLLPHALLFQLERAYWNFLHPLSVDCVWSKRWSEWSTSAWREHGEPLCCFRYLLISFYFYPIISYCQCGYSCDEQLLQLRNCLICRRFNSSFYKCDFSTKIEKWDAIFGTWEDRKLFYSWPKNRTWVFDIGGDVKDGSTTILLGNRRDLENGRFARERRSVIFLHKNA